MSGSLIQTGKKLLRAINANGLSLTFTMRQYKGIEGAMHTYFIIAKAVWNDSRHKYENHDVFSTSSSYKFVMFLRDVWYIMNNQELPTDDIEWVSVRETINFGEIING